MLNKKILAVAVAASFTTSAFAATNLDTGAGSVVIANESFTGAAVTLAHATDLKLDVKLGAAVVATNTAYVRFELTNATFGDATVKADLSKTGTDTGTNIAIDLEFGGAATDSYAVFSLSDADDNFLAADVLTFDLDDLDVTAAGTAVTASYKVYIGTGAATNSANGIADTEFASTSATTVTFGTGRGATFATAPTAQVTALVADGFTTYDVNNAATATTALTNLGRLALDQAGAINTATRVAADVTAVNDANDVYDTNSVVTLAGNFSFGDWFLHDAAACTTGNTRALTLDTEKTVATAATADFTQASWYLCNDLGTLATFDPSTDMIPKVTTAYTVTLVDDALTGTLGTIGYDTTAISLDYITVNPAYAQKIFIVNTSGSAASYTTTFTEEAGVTATGGTGSVPAQSMVTIKASDFMTITGGLRASAVIEIEADATNIKASTQIVNLTTKDTDTLSLSVK